MPEPSKEEAPEIPAPKQVTPSNQHTEAQSTYRASPKTTVKVNDLLKVEAKKEKQVSVETLATEDETFTPEQLQKAWNEFAEQRKVYQAEYQLLSLPYKVYENLITIALTNPIQETLLSNFKSDLINYLREKLKNTSLQLTSELKGADDKKVMYTNRDKFEFLMEKNPVLKELKERLQLDTDF